MSFLAGRLAGKEGAYFYQETKHAVTRLAEKSTPSAVSTTATPTSAASAAAHADVLPEVLRHSLLRNLIPKPSSGSSPPSGGPHFPASKWALRPESSSAPASSRDDALNPLRAYVSLPQVTFGPRRWELPRAEHVLRASTANELRKDRYAPASPERLKAAAEGLAMVGKAFAVATVMVFGGAAVVFILAASKLQFQNTTDIQTKVKDRAQPKFEMIREHLSPFRTWAEETSKRWHIDRDANIKERPVVKGLSKIFAARTSN